MSVWAAHMGALYTVACLTALSGAACNGSTGTSPSTTGSAGAAVDTFVGQFAVGGSASRTFTVSTAGEVAVTLREAGPPVDIVMGLGIGIPSASNVGCHQTHTLLVVPSTTPQLRASVDAGTYCVRIFDAGTMTTTVAFTISIDHP